MKYVSLLLLMTFILFSCGSDDTELIEQVQINKVQTKENLSVIFGSMNTFNMTVIYEPGAEPYAGKNPQNQNMYYWDLTQSNLAAIFNARSQQVTINIPKELKDMKQISSQNKSTWTAQEIVDLANANSSSSLTGNVGNFVVIFVKGNFKDEEGVKSGVIGINVTGTSVIAVFKDVIKAFTPGTNENIVKVFAEQSTIVHEVGHAFGLVANGLPLTSTHHDSEHGAHCTNTNCVLYWQNEGAKDLIAFVQKFLLTGSTLMLGQECLDDIKAYKVE